LAKLTIVFGILLIATGAVAFALVGGQSHAYHALIPVGFGLLLAIFGALANTPDAKKRMLFMHIAVTVGLLGFLGTIPGFIGTIQMATGHEVARPDAAKVQTVMGTLCLIFVLLCVRSFIQARRSRKAA
jgi:hypothetical protein